MLLCVKDSLSLITQYPLAHSIGRSIYCQWKVSLESCKPNKMPSRFDVVPLLFQMKNCCLSSMEIIHINSALLACVYVVTSACESLTSAVCETDGSFIHETCIIFHTPIEQITDQSNFSNCIGCRERDFFIIIHVRYALHHYNAKHPVCPLRFIRDGIQLVLINFIAISSCPELHDMTYIIDLCLQDEEFDAVKPLMESSVRFRGQVWFHINFWARSRKSKKIKRFFAEVHYKPPSSSSSVCSYLPFPVPGAERPPSSSSVSSDLLLPLPIPVVEACTIIGMYLCSIWISFFLCLLPVSWSVWYWLMFNPCMVGGCRRASWAVQEELRVLSWSLRHFTPHGS